MKAWYFPQQLLLPRASCAICPQQGEGQCKMIRDKRGASSKPALRYFQSLQGAEW